MRRTWSLQQERFICLNKMDTIHMISVLRKEACSGSIHDFAHIPTTNCLADCLTKASAKADNLITVDSHPDFRTLMEHKAFLSTWCRTFMHTREKEVFFLNTLKISCTNSPRRTISSDFVGTQQTREEEELSTREHKGQDATKTTSTLAESCIQFLWSVISMTAQTWDGEKHSKSKQHRGFHRGDR